MRKNIKRFLFLHAMYLWELFTKALYFLPPFLKSLCYKLLFKKIGANVFIDMGCYFRYPKKISIGSNVSINRNCKIFGSYHIRNAEIHIGDNVRIGPEVVIFGAGHDHSCIDLPDTAESVSIEDNVWIGGNSTILQGVTIGNGSIVAAGSVVTRNIPPMKIVGGIPAKIIKERILKHAEK